MARKSAVPAPTALAWYLHHLTQERAQLRCPPAVDLEAGEPLPALDGPSRVDQIIDAARPVVENAHQAALAEAASAGAWGLVLSPLLDEMETAHEALREAAQDGGWGPAFVKHCAAWRALRKQVRAMEEIAAERQRTRGGDEVWIPASEAVKRAEQHGVSLTMAAISREHLRQPPRFLTRQAKGQGKVKLEVHEGQFSAWLLEQLSPSGGKENPDEPNEKTKEEIEKEKAEAHRRKLRKEMFGD